MTISSSNGPRTILSVLYSRIFTVNWRRPDRTTIANSRSVRRDELSGVKLLAHGEPEEVEAGAENRELFCGGPNDRLWPGYYCPNASLTGVGQKWSEPTRQLYWMMCGGHFCAGPALAMNLKLVGMVVYVCVYRVDEVERSGRGYWIQLIIPERVRRWERDINCDVRIGDGFYCQREELSEWPKVSFKNVILTQELQNVVYSGDLAMEGVMSIIFCKDLTY